MTQEHHVSFGQVFRDVVKNEGFTGLYKVRFENSISTCAE